MVLLSIPFNKLPCFNEGMNVATWGTKNLNALYRVRDEQFWNNPQYFTIASMSSLFRNKFLSLWTSHWIVKTRYSSDIMEWQDLFNFQLFSLFPQCFVYISVFMLLLFFVLFCIFLHVNKFVETSFSFVHSSFPWTILSTYRYSILIN